MSDPTSARWTVEYHRDLESELRRLPKPYIRRVLETIEQLADDPRPPGSEKIRGHELWKIRVGMYRLLYEIDDEHRRIRTYRVGHQRDVYRRL